MATLIGDHPDRFMIGTDSTGNFSAYNDTIGKYDLLLDSLDPGTQDAIAYWNLYDVLPESVQRPDQLAGAASRPVLALPSDIRETLFGAE
jgi:hypothetical protein